MSKLCSFYFADLRSRMAGITMYAMKPVFELDAALEVPSCMYSLIRSATPSEMDCLLAMEKTKAAMMVKAKVMTQAGGLFNHRRTRQNS